MQVVYLSNRPSVMRETWQHVRHFMPWADHAIVVAPAASHDAFGAWAGSEIELVADEEISGREPSALRGLDHVRRNVALVRYDAFGEMSGRMSFSLALLNDNGDGVLISAIAGTSDTSVYAKGITNGRGEHELSPEEQQAVSTALHRPRPGLLGRKAS